VLCGQSTAATATTLDAGVALLAQEHVDAVVAPTVGLDWRLDAVRTTLRASGGATIASADRWAIQGAGAGSRFFGPSYAPREIGAAVSVVRLLGAPTTGIASVLARQQFNGRSSGGWAGGSVGVAARGHRDVAPVVALDGALWRRGELWRTTLAVSGLTAWIDSARAAGEPPATRFSALDVVGSVEWREPRFELAAALGVRGSTWGEGGPRAATSALALVSATVPLRPGVALVGSAGNQYTDPLRGVPAVRHFALALRIRPSALGANAPRRPRAPPDTIGTGSGVPGVARPTTLEVLGAEAEGRTVRVSAPGARRVELRSDATGWQSVDLARRGDYWEALVPLGSGTHHVMLRVDEGEWAPPGNLPTVEDDFGSRVGLLVVP